MPYELYELWFELMIRCIIQYVFHFFALDIKLMD